MTVELSGDRSAEISSRGTTARSGSHAHWGNDGPQLLLLVVLEPGERHGQYGQLHEVNPQPCVGQASDLHVFDVEDFLVSTGDGEEVEYKWFGFKDHLLCDSKYQLPILALVAKETSSDSTYLLVLLQEFVDRHPQLAARNKQGAADMAYDSEENTLVYEKLTGGELLCPTRKLWKTGDFEYTNQSDKQVLLKMLPVIGNEDLCYDQDGQVYCCFETDRDKWEFYPMAFKGFEKDRQTLKYVCPAAHYGFECPGREECDKGLGRTVRVKRHVNPRRLLRCCRIRGGPDYLT